MNDLAIAVRDFIISAGSWFGKFLDLGGQAFINVMGDIVVLVGTILAEVIRDAVNLVTKFMNSWAGSALIGAVAITLDIVAGAIKGVLIIVEKCHVALEVFLALWGTWKFTKVISGIGDTTTSIGKLVYKLYGLKVDLADNLTQFGKWIKDGLIAGGKACKTLADAMAHPIKTVKSFGETIVLGCLYLKDWIVAVKDNAVKAIGKFTENIGKNISSLGRWAKEVGRNAVDSLKNLLISIGSSISGLLGLTAAEAGATAGATALNIALGALGIGVIIAAIAGLVIAVKEIGDKFGWWTNISNALSSVLDWVGEKVGWLWDKVKSFFGWNDEPAANANFDSIGTHAEEAAKTTDDAFGTATSNVNQYLDSIHFDATRLAEEVSEATATASEKFGMLSQNAQEYLNAILNNDTERLAQMGENQSAYMEEVKAMYSDLTEAEKNEFLKQYGIVKGINDDMLNYEGLSYNERVARHAAYLSTIEKDDSLSYQEKKAKIDQANIDFQNGINQEVAIHQEAMNSKKQQLEALVSKRGKLTDEEKQLEKDLTAAIAEEQRIIDSLTDTSYDTRVTTAEEANSEIQKANNKSTEAQAKAYDDLSKTSDKAMKDINKGLKDSEKNIQGFVKESKNQADKLKKAFDGIGKKISEEFDKGIKDAKSKTSNFAKDAKTQADKVKKAFDGIGDKISGEFKKAQKGVSEAFNQISRLTTSVTSNLSNSWATALTRVANDIRSKLDTIKSIYQAFSTSIINKTNELVNSVTSKISGLHNSYRGIFDRIRQVADSSMNSVYSKVNSSLNNIRSLFNNFNATLRVKIPHFYMTGRFNAETGQVPKVGVNYFARGGVVDRATLGVFGEAGKEAIVPLEHNTEWMDTLEGIMGAAFNKAMQGNNSVSAVNDQPINLTIQVGQTTLGRVAIDSINKLQRRAGRTLIRV